MALVWYRDCRSPRKQQFQGYYWAASRKVGGLGVVGSRVEVEPQATSAEGYKRPRFRPGFTYIGKGQPTLAGVTEDRFTRTRIQGGCMAENFERLRRFRSR
jgi:hypothetical protein